MRSNETIAAEVVFQIERKVDDMGLTSNVVVRYEAEDADALWPNAIYVYVYALHPYQQIWGCEVNEFTGQKQVDWLLKDCFHALEILNAWIGFEAGEVYRHAVAVYDTDETWEIIEILLQAFGFEDADEIKRCAEVMRQMISDLPRGEQIERLARLACLHNVKLIH